METIGSDQYAVCELTDYLNLGMVFPNDALNDILKLLG
jgi:hypothetical protein